MNSQYYNKNSLFSNKPSSMSSVIMGNGMLTGYLMKDFSFDQCLKNKNNKENCDEYYDKCIVKWDDSYCHHFK
jgi:hypothetical protein